MPPSEAGQQDAQRGLRQGDKPVLVALGVAHMYALARRVDIAYLQSQTFTQAQAHAVDGEAWSGGGQV